MASRAQVIHDYSFDSDTRRPRRQLRFQTADPIVLPRSSVWSTGAGLIAVALAVGAIVVGSAYAAFHSDAPAMHETPTISLERDWQPLSANARAGVTNLLSGPALAVPNVAAPTNGTEIETDTPLVSSPAEGLLIDDSAPRAQQQFPRVAPNPTTHPEAPATLTPNPRTTPPDAIAPSNAGSETPTPVLDPENPY